MKYLETVATAQKRTDIFHITAGSGDSHYGRPDWSEKLRDPHSSASPNTENKVMCRQDQLVMGFYNHNRNPD